MKCRNCGYDNNNNEDLFCNYCGSRLNIELENKSGLPDLPAQPVKDSVPKVPEPKKNNTASTIAIAVAVVVSIAIICGTVLAISKGKKEDAPEKDTSYSQNVSDENGDNDESTDKIDKSDDSAVDAGADDYGNKNDNNNNKDDYYMQISAGTRCRVDSYIDGSKSLAVKAKPQRSSETIAWAGRDNYVTVIEDYYSGERVRISLLSEGETYEGWVLVEYLHIVDDEEGTEDYGLTPGTTCRVTNQDGLNLWKRPRKTDGSNGKIPYGSYVEILIQYNINDNGYVYVNHDGTKGWMNAEYLEISSGYDVTKETSVYTEKQEQTTTEATTEEKTTKEHTLSVEFTRAAFEKAREAFFYYFETIPVDPDEVYENEYGIYSKVLDNISSLEELEEIFHEFFTHNVCETLLFNYIEHDGALYFFNGGYDWGANYKVKSESVVENGDGWDYVLLCDATYIDGSREEVTLRYYMEYVNGKHVFLMDIESKGIEFE